MHTTVYIDLAVLLFLRPFVEIEEHGPLEIDTESVGSDAVDERDDDQRLHESYDLETFSRETSSTDSGDSSVLGREHGNQELERSIPLQPSSSTESLPFSSAAAVISVINAIRNSARAMHSTESEAETHTSDDEGFLESEEYISEDSHYSEWLGAESMDALAENWD